MAAVSDTIDQMTICVASGMGFDAALSRVATTNRGPLATELQHTVSDMRAGVPRDQALRALADRTQIPEIKTLVQALIQAQRNGTPLSDTLRIQAAESRDQRKQAIEEQAAKLGTKLIFPTVLLFFPVIFVVLLAPSVAAFIEGLRRLRQQSQRSGWRASGVRSNRYTAGPGDLPLRGLSRTRAPR